MGTSIATDTSLLEKATGLAEKGRLDEAYELICILAFNTSRASQVRALKAAWRAALLDKLRKRFSNLNAYPQRLTSNTEVKRFQVKSREAFILGLIDGTVTLDDVLAISPVDELDTLRAMARLIDLGLLGIGTPA